MSLRPPRVAVVFDGGAQWQFWARMALHACTRIWGGDGFILVPHRDGEVRPELRSAVRAYDPDYVVVLQRTVRATVEALPGSAARMIHGWEVADDTRREELIRLLGDEPIDYPADAQARDKVANACCPHRRRDDPGTTSWNEDVTTLDIHGSTMRLTRIADIPNIPDGACLSAAPDLGGNYGVAAAARCGALEEPRAGTDDGLDDRSRRRLAYWLLYSDSRRTEPPPEVVWGPNAVLTADPASLTAAFDRTRYGIVPISRGFRQRSALISVGDSADDFALAYAYQRVYGNATWLPITWWEPGARSSLVKFLIHSIVSDHVHKGERVVVSTTSVADDTIDDILSYLRRPTSWIEGGYEPQSERFRDHVTLGPVDWPQDGAIHLAVDGHFDQDFVIPVINHDTGDIEMVAPCPPPVIHQPGLAASAQLQWQVDVELVEAVTPRGRGIDGHTLLAHGEDPYLTWVRSGRDGIVYESQRFNFILRGMPPVARLARPRFQAPAIARWADLMASQTGGRMVLSPAGRRVEVMRRLWGDRAAMAAQFGGPMLSVLRAFRPARKKADVVALPEEYRVVLSTGDDRTLWEAYLTFAGMMTCAGIVGERTSEFRGEIDSMVERAVLRRGLILDCVQCGRPAFISIDDVAQVNRCARCSTPNSLSQPRWKKPATEPRWYYDLHPVVREHLAQDGEVPLLLAHHLRNSSRSYVDAAELELADISGERLAEADLIALSDGQLITAEAKRPNSLGEGRGLVRAVAKRALIAEQLQADQIIIATTADSWQQASIEALCREIRERPWPVVVPRARLVNGLGTSTVTDLAIDIETGQTMPWAS